MTSPPRAQAIPLNLRQIEVFHAIMVSGSLSDAGRMLCVSQPAVSRVLATTESRLKFLLFERVRGRLHATPEARRLFSEVEPIMAGVGHFNRVARGLAEGEGDEGRLSIVSSPSYSEWLVPRAIERFRALHPDVHIAYRPLPFDTLLPHMLLGRADLCISSMAPPVGAELVARDIGEGEIMCAVPRGHALAALGVIRAGDLRGQTLIGYGRDTPFGELTGRFLEGVVPRIEIRSTPEALALVRQGVGVALVESFGFSAQVSDVVVLRAIAPAVLHKIYLIHSRGVGLSRVCQGFLGCLRGVLDGVGG